MTHKEKRELFKKGMNWLRQTGIKSLYNVLDNINLDVGVGMMDSCGHGILKPNIILVGYKNDWFNSSDEEVETYLNALKYNKYYLYYKLLIVRLTFCLYSKCCEYERTCNDNRSFVVNF